MWLRMVLRPQHYLGIAKWLVYLRLTMICRTPHAKKWMYYVVTDKDGSAVLFALETRFENFHDILLLAFTINRHV